MSIPSPSADPHPSAAAVAGPKPDSAEPDTAMPGAALWRSLMARWLDSGR